MSYAHKIFIHQLFFMVNKILGHDGVIHLHTTKPLAPSTLQ